MKPINISQTEFRRMEYLLGKHLKSTLSLKEEEELRTILIKEFPSLKDSSENIVDAGIMLVGTTSLLKNDSHVSGNQILNGYQIITDDYICYEGNRKNTVLLDRLAPIIIGRIGKNNLILIIVGSLIFGILMLILNPFIIHVDSFFHSFFLVVGLIALMTSFLFFSILQYHRESKCHKCGKEYAYQECGIPRITETATSKGTEKTIFRKYKCKYCGDVREIPESSIIPHKKDG